MYQNSGYQAETRIVSNTRSMRVRPINNASLFVEGREHADYAQQTITLKGMKDLIQRITNREFDLAVDSEGERKSVIFIAR